jgi:toxin CptA
MRRDRPLLQPFAVALRPSRLWLSLVLGALAGYVLLLALYLPARYLFSVPLAAWLAWRAARANGWWRGAAPQRLEIDPRGRLFLCQGGLRQEAEVLDDCFVTPVLTVLNLKVAGKRRSVMLWPDSADAEARRLLRVYLLWFEPPQPSDQTESTP